MVMRFIYILLLFLLFFEIQAQEAVVKSVEQIDQKIHVIYDLVGDENHYEVNLFVSSDEGKTWEGPLQQLSGDIGKDIAIGQNKTVIWDVLMDREKFQGDWVFGFEVKETKFDYFIDERDGKTYKTVKIGNQVWMAENLAYKPSSGNYWAYNVAKYGYLYGWQTAKNVCPTGWHLPRDYEWSVLKDYLGGEQVAGTKMKSSLGWRDNGNGTNESGFNAFPGGFLNGIDINGFISSIGDEGYWWSSSSIAYKASVHVLMKYDGNVLRWYSNKTVEGEVARGYSVRCLRD